MCWCLGLQGSGWHIKALSLKSSKLVVNSAWNPACMPVNQGFFEIINHFEQKNYPFEQFLFCRQNSFFIITFINKINKQLWFFNIYKIYSYPFYKNIAAYIISPLSVKDERDILIVEDDATTRSASLLYDEAFFIFVIITIDFPQQHLFSRRSWWHGYNLFRIHSVIFSFIGYWPYKTTLGITSQRTWTQNKA